MSQSIMTVSRQIFFRLLAYAPEELQRLAKEDARRAIPALCFTEDDIRQKFAEDERWNGFLDDVQREAITALLDVGEYERAGTAANEAIAEAVDRYLREAFDEAELFSPIHSPELPHNESPDPPEWPNL